MQGRRAINLESAVFGWFGALLQMSLCSRVEILDDVHLSHFSWSGDHMVTRICRLIYFIT
jgi:hypothetical protein